MLSPEHSQTIVMHMHSIRRTHDVIHVKNACFFIKRSRYIHAWDMGHLHAEDKNLMYTMATIQQIHTNHIVHDSCTPGLLSLNRHELFM